MKPLIRPETQYQRGSVLVLVVVVLALMSMLGVAYIQIARVDRMATRAAADSHIDTVVDATIQYIGQVLKDDVVDSDGNFLHDEPYDYPWTNTDSTFEITLMDGITTREVSGGMGDDMWLASTVPDFTDTPQWPHLTNLNGIYLRLGASIEEIPLDYSGTDWENRNVDQHLLDLHNNQDLADDVDGDGVPDARWTWAPLRQIAGIQYVMAVRIVDNSSMINVNLATALTDPSSNDNESYSLDPLNLPRGYFPTDLDLSRLFRRSVIPGWGDDLNTLLDTRGMTPNQPTLLGLDLSTYPSPPGGGWSTDGRIGQWFEYGRKGIESFRFDLSNERELRYRGGLNNEKLVRDIENVLPNLLREDGSGTPEPDMPLNPDVHMAYFLGATGATGPTITPVASREFPFLRHMLTTWNGHALWATDWTTNPSQNGEALKYDLLHAEYNTGTEQYNEQRIVDLARRIYRVLSIPVSAGGAMYLGMDDASIQVTSLEFALAIQAYSNRNLTPPAAYLTGKPDAPFAVGMNPDSSGKTYFGFTMLPLLREVYLQVGYEAIDYRDEEGREPSDPDYTEPDGLYDRWEIVDGTQALAIELGNPFNHDWDSKSYLDGRVRIRIVEGGEAKFTYTFGDTPATPDLASREHLVVYVNPANPLTEENGVEPADLADPTNGLDLSAADHVMELPSGTLTFTAPTNDDPVQITVELQVLVGDDLDNEEHWRTYDRLTDPNLVMPRAYDITGAPLTVAENRHRQVSLQRGVIEESSVSSLHFLTNWGNELKQRDIVGEAVFRHRAAGNALDALGENIKGNLGHSNNNHLNNLQWVIPHRPILSVAELSWILMPGFYHDPADSTVGDLPGSLTDLVDWEPKSLFLDFADDADVPDGSANPHAAIPHAAMLLEQFTTLSPEAGQLPFAPGTMNINTAPLHLLTLAAPLPEDVGDVEALMKSIIEYRDDTDSRGANFRGAPGIASMGELMFINPDTSGGPANMQQYRETAPPAGGSSAYPHRLSPMPEDGALPYAHTHGQITAASRFQFLSQAFTTRSDVFTAYILIRGYRVGETTPVEARRLFVVFDRSNITSPDDSPRVRAMYVYE